MYDKLFERPDVVQQHRTGPSAEERLRFLHHRAKLGASRLTLIQREFPRLCRGGSKSLTVPGVHPRNSYREPRSTRRGETGWTSMKA